MGLSSGSSKQPGTSKPARKLDLRETLSLTSDGGDFYVLRPNGDLVTHLKLDGPAVQPVAIAANQSIAVRTGDRGIALMGVLPAHFGGGSDVEPAEIKREWKLSNPISIDLGADILHHKGITGQGVTVAVIDSGVYFNKHIEDILGTDLDRQFLGQVDFVADGKCSGSGHQYASFCFSDHANSRDRYGHGSHVAGIIWSQIVDYNTGASMGIAPDANILSVKVLDDSGMGSYTDIVEGIQYVVENKDLYNVRIMNLSLSATPTTPYFADPINRAVEAAWANGIVVLAAAGNTGPGSETITTPGNDPYVITVGSVNNQRTPGYWEDDIVAAYSASGPTLDGFIKPDVLTPGSYIISFMYTNKVDENSARLALTHPNYSRSVSLFRMSGTSMSTAVASGVVALMLQVNPGSHPGPGEIPVEGDRPPGGYRRREPDL